MAQRISIGFQAAPPVALLERETLERQEIDVLMEGTEPVRPSRRSESGLRLAAAEDPTSA